MKNKLKIGLVCSRGGHLLQLFVLKKWWSKYEHFWITGKGGDCDYLLKGEKIYFGFFPEHRNLLNALKNLILGLRVLSEERPDLLVSTGAGIAPPIFLIGKILGCKLVFLDSYTFIKYPSLSAKLVSLIADKVLVQHQAAVNFFAKAEYWGSVL